LIDEAGQPTIAARDEILSFFTHRLVRSAGRMKASGLRVSISMVAEIFHPVSHMMVTTVASVQLFGQSQRGDDVGAGRRPRKQAFLPSEPKSHGFCSSVKLLNLIGEACLQMTTKPAPIHQFVSTWRRPTKPQIRTAHATI